MKDSRGVFIKRFLCVQTNTKLFNNENKLYCFFLHEDFYSLISQNTDASTFGKNSAVLRKSNIKKDHRARGFLTSKYCIFLFRSTRFSSRKRSFFSQTRSNDEKRSVRLEKRMQLKKKFFVDLIFESIAFILLDSQKKNADGSFGNFEKKFFGTKHLSISIHKPLASLENQRQYSSFGFQGCFSRFFHPEVLVRILRKKIQDISFLHLLRTFLHSKFYLSNEFFKESSTKKVRRILWNIYFFEIDNFFVSNCKNYCTSDEQNSTSSNYSLSCFQKIKEWTFFLQKKEYNDFFETKTPPYEIFSNIIRRNSKEHIWDKRRQNSFLVQSSTYKYFRTSTNWFLFFQKKKTWTFFIRRRIRLFFIRRLGYVLPEKTISLTVTSSDYSKKILSYFFLAYILQFPKKRNFVKINTKLFFLINYFVRRIVSFWNPFYLIILILSKQNFCNSFGYPKSKSGWVTWTDSDIIHKFNRVQNSLFSFYSGCTNTKALSRIQYILQFSCAKTLACKHKTNLNHISKKFRKTFSGKDLSKNLLGNPLPKPASSTFFVTNQSKNVRLRSLWKNQKKTRLWNFHLTQLDSIIFQLEDFYRVASPSRGPPAKVQ